MLEFRAITLADKEMVETYTHQHETMLCEHCFVDLYIWGEHYKTEICQWQDFLFVRCQSVPDRKQLYLAPIGQGDIKQAVKMLEQDAISQNVPFQLISIPEGLLPIYQDLFANRFDFVSYEDNSDYIYLREKLATLAGKKLQPKRNLVNRFKANYEGRWQYVNMTSENVEEARAFHKKWCHMNGYATHEDFLGEAHAVRRALDHFEALGLQGGLLYLDGEVIAYTLGYRAWPDMYVMQIEKADTTIDGAYQMIHQQFVLANCAEVTYINREEDLGVAGLRRAKQSYQPVLMGKKYTMQPRESTL